MSENRTLERLKKKLSKQTFVQDLYEKRKAIKDKRFGEVDIWSRKTGDDIALQKKRRTSNKSQCEKDIEHAKERLSLNHDYLMKMLDYAVKVEAEDKFEVWGFYQAPLQDLKKEIKRRARLNK